MPTVKPLDVEAVLSATRKTKCIITIEEHSIVGGLGSAVSEALTFSGFFGVPLKCIGLPDAFSSEVGGQEYLRDLNELSAEGIAWRVKLFWESLDFSGTFGSAGRGRNKS